MNVYVVLEHSHEDKDAVVHGAYLTRAGAATKKFRLTAKGIKNRKPRGYICILETNIRGNL